MPERNTALLAATIVFIFLASGSTGTLFVLMLEKDEYTAAFGAEVARADAVKKETARRNVELNGDASSVKGYVRSLEELKQNITNLDQRLADNKRREKEAKDAAAGTIDQVQPATSQVFSSIQRGFSDIQEERRMMKTAEDAFNREKATLLREIDRVKRELKRKKEENESDIATIQGEIARVQTDLSEVNDKLKILREKRELADVLEEDGQIIQVGSSDTNYVAIDLGWADGVRKAMKFDVFEVRGGDTKFRKGQVEITKVHAHSSDANILPPKRRNPICPQCGWEAYKPDMRYCIYCALGDNNDEIQPLDEKVSGVLIKPQDPFNPIVRGDKISNPFYYKGRKIHFAYAGEPVVRSRREIELYIKENDGILDDEIKLETDYLVVGTGVHVKEALDKARRLGVKVMQELELYQFFGKEGND